MDQFLKQSLTMHQTKTLALPRETLQKLFENQVQIHPDHAAVISKVQALTYTQLNARANQLARYLISLGAGPEVKGRK